MNSPHVRALLSAYLDGEVTPAEHAQVERHLVSCPECTRILAEYRDLGSQVRTLSRPLPPATLHRDVWTAIEAREGRSAWGTSLAGLLRYGAVTAVLALAVIGAWLLLRPAGPQFAAQPRYPLPGQSGVARNSSVDIEFTRPLATPQPIDQIIQLAPTAPITPTLVHGGDTLLLQGDWAANTLYTITVLSSTLSAEGKTLGHAVTWQFTTGDFLNTPTATPTETPNPTDTPVPTDTPLPPTDTPPPTLPPPTVVALVPTSPPVVPPATVTRAAGPPAPTLPPTAGRPPAPTATAPPAPFTVTPVPAASATAAASATSAVVPSPTPPPASPTASHGPPTATAEPATATPTPVIAHMPPGTTPTASPTPGPQETATSEPISTPGLTPSPGATSTAPPEGTPTATRTPGGSACQYTTQGNFDRVYQDSYAIRSVLGCPTNTERAIVTTAIEPFQYGFMFWDGDQKQIYVFDTSQMVYFVYADTWVTGDPSGGTATPPAGYYAPVRGFGKVWQEHNDVQTRLGWATAPETGAGAAAVQAFERGSMLRTDSQAVRVLYANGAWENVTVR